MSPAGGSWGYRNVVTSGTLLGGAVDNDAVSVGDESGDDIEAAAGQIDNVWKADDVLNWAYSTAEFDSAVGEEGCEGTEPANYQDHNVDDVPDHFSYHEPGDGCMPEVVAQFSGRGATDEDSRARSGCQRRSTDSGEPTRTGHSVGIPAG